MVIAGLIVILFLAAFNAVPLAFFAMLFLGNVGVHLSFLAVYPGAVALKFFQNSVLTGPVVNKSA